VTTTIPRTGSSSRRRLTITTGQRDHREPDGSDPARLVAVRGAGEPMGVSVFYPGGHVQPSIVFDEHCPATSK